MSLEKKKSLENLYNSDKTGECLVLLTAVFLLQKIKLKLYTLRKTCQKSSDICLKLVFALCKKLACKTFLCLVFQEGILYSVEFIQWLLFFASKCLMISPDSCLSHCIFINAIKLIQIHIFCGFYLSPKCASKKNALLIGQLIPKV